MSTHDNIASNENAPKPTAEIKKKHKSKTDNIELKAKFIEVMPKLFWCLFALIIFATFKEPIEKEIPFISKFKFRDFEVELKKRFEAISSDSLGKKADLYFSPSQIDLIIRRSAQLDEQLKKTQILWVDINFYNYDQEVVQLFEKMGVKVDGVLSDSSAFESLENSIYKGCMYNLIITSNHHAGHHGNKVGEEFADSIRTKFKKADIPIILFSQSAGNPDSIEKYGVPKNVFAATIRADYLFQFVFDAIERGTAPYPSNIQRYLTPMDTLARTKL
jgi:hypothetical protein